MFARFVASVAVAGALCGIPTEVQAQCTGQLAAGAICGNPTASQAPARGALPSAFPGVGVPGEVIVTAPPYNAKCDWNGTTGTDDTAAITAAIAAVPSGGTLLLPSTKCRVVGSGSAIFTLTAPITIQGMGSHPSSEGGGFVIATGVPSTRDLFHIVGVTNSTLRGWYFRGFNVIPQTTAVGQHVFHFDSTAGTTTGFAEVLIDNIYASASASAGGYTVNLNNGASVNSNGGTFNYLQRGGWLGGGTNCIKCGDSIRDEDNIITGDNAGFVLDQVSGAGGFKSSGSNITSGGGCIIIKTAINPIVEPSTLCEIGTTTNANLSLIDIQGPVAGGRIGGAIQALAGTNATRLVRIANTTGLVVDGGRFGEQATVTAVRVESSSASTCVTAQNSYTGGGTDISDASTSSGCTWPQFQTFSNGAYVNNNTLWIGPANILAWGIPTIGIDSYLYGEGTFGGVAGSAFRFVNNAGNVTLNLGGDTVLFPCITRLATALKFRLCDNSADAPVTTGALTVTGSFTATGLVTNADLANPATTVNGQICTLGSTCTVTAVPSGSAGGDLTGTYPSPTLAAIISAGGPTGSATVAPIITYDAKGRLTAVSSATITPAVGSITGLGTGVAAFLATPSSANLVAAVTDETGSGALVFATSPTLVTPALGVATATSLAIGGATLGSNALAVTGTATISSDIKGRSLTATGQTDVLTLAANTLIMDVGGGTTPRISAYGPNNSTPASLIMSLFSADASVAVGLVTMTATSALSDSQVTMNGTSTSSSKITGSLVNKGGFGNAGAIYTDTLSVITMANTATTSSVCYNTGTGLFTYNGTVGTCTVSDARLKNVEGPIESALDRLLKINGIYFNFKDPEVYGRGRQIGVLAQNVETVFPEIVATDSAGTKSVDYQKLVVPLIEALRELKADNDNLRGRLDGVDRAMQQRRAAN